jgi:hypothetical protein
MPLMHAGHAAHPSNSVLPNGKDATAELLPTCVQPNKAEALCMIVHERAR